MKPRLVMSPRHELPWAWVALFAWFACTAWMRPLMLPDEGRYAGIAWEMLRSGQWAVPTLDGLPFFHKPPLFYWISAAAMHLFGPTAWAARMPSILGATLGAGALFVFTRRWSGASHARKAALVLATQPFFFIGGQFANLDMLVAGCITATVLLGAHAVLGAAEGRPHRLAVIGAYGMAGLGVLAKGLIGVVLPGAVAVAWLLAVRRPRLILPLLSLPGLLLFVLVALPWFVAMQRAYPGFYDYFVVYHHFERFSKGGFNNQQPFWFYVPVVLLLTLPWSLVVPATLRRRSEPAAGPSVRLLMWCWAGVIVVFFSLPKSKLVGYVLPALPPLGWLLSDALSGRLSRHTGALALSAALACTSVAGFVALSHQHSTRPLGLALRGLRAPGEPVLVMRRYAYDLPFYARLESPPMVLDDWTDATIALHDDWRKELFDAGQFDRANMARRLVGRDALPQLLCAQPRSWIVASAAQVRAEPLLASAREVGRVNDLALWQLQPRCETPSAGSAGR